MWMIVEAFVASEDEETPKLIMQLDVSRIETDELMLTTQAKVVVHMMQHALFAYDVVNFKVWLNSTPLVIGIMPAVEFKLNRKGTA